MIEPLRNQYECWFLRISIKSKVEGPYERCVGYKLNIYEFGTDMQRLTIIYGLVQIIIKVLL